MALLRDLLRNRLALKEFGGFLFAHCCAERILQKLARLQAIGARVSLGPDGGLSLGRNDHFDYLGHEDSPRLVLESNGRSLFVRSREAPFDSGNALLNTFDGVK